MKEFWNDRFEKEDFIYGEEPNTFFKSQLDSINSCGKSLFPMEGEGRNACYASNMGWEVDAFDYSEAGKRKAEQLCNKKQFSINYSISTAQDYNYQPNTYDLVVLIYAHLQPEWRHQFHQNIFKSLKPGGRLVLEAFHPNQLTQHYTSGGPKNQDMLYTLQMLEKDFQNMTKIQGEELEIQLDEGKYHEGKGFVTRLTGVK
ncbi:class I SAM-dependent methyltransferase [Psychroflexus tropicus]|uniref:class I SAM-dependent methyltransferase n=1 Tax=Psychroflexus tropicus TaxID=197345 RepID=UPI00035D7319|nr:class I SAM-dependent methyltransferase [Psychroflexus tropicus]